jgi:hypothetical protein
MQIGPSWFAIMGIAFLVLFFCLLLAIVITLLATPATRKAGLILLAFFAGLLALLVGSFAIRAITDLPRPAYRPQPRPVTLAEYVEGRATRFPASPSTPPSPLPMPSPSKTMFEAPATLPEDKQPLDKALTAESSRLIEALSKVLAKTILADPKTWHSLPPTAQRLVRASHPI